MICAFRNLKSYDKFISTLNDDDKDTIKDSSLHAIHNNYVNSSIINNQSLLFDIEEEIELSTSLYCCLIPNKILSKRDERGEDDLRLIFNSSLVESAAFSKIWDDENRSWSDCFDIINSLVTSTKHKVTFEDCSCGFIISNEEWPTLLNNNKNNLNVNDNDNDNGNWSILSIRNLSIDGDIIDEEDYEIIESKNLIPDNEFIIIEEEEDNVDNIEINMIKEVKKNKNSNKIIIDENLLPVKKSYRDVILSRLLSEEIVRKEKEREAELYLLENDKKKTKIWTPIYSLQNVSYKRVDREYGISNCTNINYEGNIYYL